ncbi:AAA family ATPase [Candidatus Micrarchaeota archaeon]|nr:AAA family ATPase [Candidatus Micrarchaeota archaeon]
MAGNIFHSLGKESSIFKNEKVLMPDYIPNELLHRENEIKELALCLRTASKGERPENIIVAGPPGTGKTCSVRYVLKQLGEYSKSILPIYINCWEFSTRHSILTQIAIGLGEFVPRRGIATDEITINIVETLKKEKRTPIIALDEVDKLASQVEDIKILYDLARSNEIFSINIGLIGISNSLTFLSRIDSRIKSSLSQRILEFERYTPQQLRDILKERAKIAFVSGAVDEDILGLCAGIGMKNNGDARIAIQTLWLAGREAEKRNSGNVSIDDVKLAANLAPRESKLGEIKFDKVENEIIDILRKKGEITTTEIYALINRKPRTVRKYILILIKKGILKSKSLPRSTTDGRKPRLIWLKEPGK